MKNKKSKKSEFKTEIKRPAHKKPRAKKYVEAKIPELPPVPTTQLQITKEQLKIDESSLPDDGRLAELVCIANKTLEDAIERKKIILDISRIYEPCPLISERVDREKLRFHFKNKDSQLPVGINADEEIYSKDTEVVEATQQNL